MTGERTSASGLRRVVARPRKRIDPDEPIRRALQASRLELQARRIAALPAVGDEQNDRASAEDAARPAQIELMERIADARSTRPVGHCARDAPERGVRAALAQLPRDAREPRSEGECLDATPTARQRMGHMQEQPGVGLHRTRDIAEDHERPPLRARRATQEHHGLAARAQHPPQRRARIEPRPVAARAKAPAGPLAGRPSQALQESRGGRALRGRHRREVDLAQELDRARNDADRALDERCHSRRHLTERHLDLVRLGVRRPRAGHHGREACAPE